MAYKGIETDISPLVHYGTPRHSGRYPWGSGENPYQHEEGFYKQYEDIRNNGKTYLENAAALGMSREELIFAEYGNLVSTYGKSNYTGMAKELGMSSTEVRQHISNINSKHTGDEMRRCQELSNKGYSVRAIAERTGMAPSTVQARLNAIGNHTKLNNQDILGMLKKAVDDKGVIDIGKGVEGELGTTKTRLLTLATALKEEGYRIFNFNLPNATDPSKATPMVVLAKADPEKTEAQQWKDIVSNPTQVQTINSYKVEQVKAKNNLPPVQFIDKSRVFVKYDETGGTAMDGTIMIRPGVSDLSLGDAHYAQVRIGVDCDGDPRYMKGMAFYSNDIPKGYDVVYNTNKEEAKGIKALKSVLTTSGKTLDDNPNGEIDWEHPWAGNLRTTDGQYYYSDDNGEVRLGALNKLKQEGDWLEQRVTLPTQLLSKQPPSTITKQLDAAYSARRDELDSIKKISQPELKQAQLLAYAETTDKAAVEMRGAAFPGQSTKVLLPIPDLKPTECYCPTYPTGTKVCLVRFPHADISEIPTLIVNNNSKAGKDIVGSEARDAIGINQTVAERLSGADFDGDTVTTIPLVGNTRIATRPQLEGMKGWSPDIYKAAPGVKITSKDNQQREMGIISNLITDMNLKGAEPEDICRAIKYSMVVIDAVKHKYDMKAAKADLGIDNLNDKYRMNSKGAGTIISRAKSPVTIQERTKASIDPETGEQIFRNTGNGFTDRETGEFVYKSETIPKLAYFKDANDIKSDKDNPISVKENYYANFSNGLKRLANEARLEYLKTPNTVYDKKAASEYMAEVASLNGKLDNYAANSPKERQAQIYAYTSLKTAKQTNETLQGSSKEAKAARKDYGRKALTEGRQIFGTQSNKYRQIEITENEWAAIKAGALSHTKIQSLISAADAKPLLERELPREERVLSDTKLTRANTMLANGRTYAETADALGVNVSTLIRSISKV